jgi:hypothetical protein
MREVLAVILLAAVLAPVPAGAGDPAPAPVADAPAAPRGYVRPPAKEGYSYPDCYCTDSEGTRVEVGELACLRIGRREVLSRCMQADNLTVWRHQREGCPGV